MCICYDCITFNQNLVKATLLAQPNIKQVQQYKT